MPERTCSVEDCDRKVLGRGWCSAHYAKWRKYGDPLAVFQRSPRPTCAAVACDEPVHAHGLCANHYARRSKRRNPPKVRTTEIVRRIDKSGGCWLWRGSRDPAGYGRFYFRGEGALAHRVVFELYAGPIPDGLVLDHLCRVRRCVNPAHLEPVSLVENVLRGVGAPALNARKTECKWGHALTADNVILRPDGRECRTCARENQRVSRMRSKLRQKGAA